MSLNLPPIVSSYCKLAILNPFSPHLLSTPAANLTSPLTDNRALDGETPLTHLHIHPSSPLCLENSCPPPNKSLLLHSRSSPLIRCLAQYSFSLLTHMALHLNTFKDALFKQKCLSSTLWTPWLALNTVLSYTLSINSQFTEAVVFNPGCTLGSSGEIFKNPSSLDWTTSQLQEDGVVGQSF